MAVCGQRRGFGRAPGGDHDHGFADRGARQRDQIVPQVLRQRRAGVEDDLQQEVAELFCEVGVVAALDGVEDLVGLFQSVFSNRVEGLFAVPGAAAGAAQPSYDLDHFAKKFARFFH